MCLQDKKLKLYHAGAYYHHEALDGTGYPQGLSGDNIPYEAQIIRVADEYDAIVSKRQYKSHINISDTLKILIENTNPSSNSKNTLFTSYGKNNKKVVKCLIKVVVDDIGFEIYHIKTHIKYLSENISRLKEAIKYKNKMDKTKSQKKKQYYLDGIKYVLKNNETPDNLVSVYEEYISAIQISKNTLIQLNNEIKIIKTLKI